MKASTIKIAIADDHSLIRQGISFLLMNQKKFVVTGQYANGQDLLSGLEAELPHVLLLDINLPDTTGNELVRILSKKYPSLRIIALTGLDTSFHIRDMMRHGCSGYLLKSSDSAILLEAIDAVIQGNKFVDPALREQVMNMVIQPEKSQELTKREQQILQLISEGVTNNIIAEKLCLSLRTIENHRFTLYQKFKVNNMASLVKVAMQLGLVE